jgi:hypothetical protein
MQLSEEEITQIKKRRRHTYSLPTVERGNEKDFCPL